MGDLIHMPWLSRRLTVIESTDPTLIGVSGTVQDETRRTIRVMTENGPLTLAKGVMRFTIDDEEIDGAIVTQRPEDRINRRYRRT
ncbi:MAG: ribonuclease P protein subunit [Candidatus Thermoplasmatota archaeon]|uniref:Ribonuclease P protein component 1 n=1 Tax=uncultured marine group II euryarchaeote KM3-85-F5 TaxID=526684 RepID=B3V5H0_9ARCH|nr:RNaseE subunit P29 [uncultured marine group II euryarchaeote KM3-85-F5]MEC8998614.1 ribonuclease P protein subunit [Candidatus Thermoplasmatota archaeon]MEE2650844.1 ribonuclease P protein subunit [Candidatus Thermoplasmatota archaeon]